jgi:hypothetical protein
LTKANADLEKERNDRKMEQETLAKEKTKLTGEIAELQNQLKAAEAQAMKKEVINAGDEVQKNFQKYRTPDPDLATFVVLIDSVTNLAFLEQDLVDFYTLNNHGLPNGGFVIVDVAEGGKLRESVTSFPLRKDQLNYDKLYSALVFNHVAEANSENFVKDLNRLFVGASTKKQRHQVILIAGQECPVPSVQAWAAFPHPVHACLLSNGTPLKAESQQAWTQFCQAKKGEVLFLAEQLKDPVDQSIARGKIEAWMNERLLPVPRWKLTP